MLSKTGDSDWGKQWDEGQSLVCETELLLRVHTKIGVLCNQINIWKKRMFAVGSMLSAVLSTADFI